MNGQAQVVSNDSSQTLDLFLKHLGDLGRRVDENRSSLAEFCHFVQQLVVPVIANANHCQRDAVLAGKLGGLEAIQLVAIGLAVGKQDQVTMDVIALPALHLLQTRFQPLQ